MFRGCVGFVGLAALLATSAVGRAEITVVMRANAPEVRILYPIRTDVGGSTHFFNDPMAKPGYRASETEPNGQLLHDVALDLPLDSRAPATASPVLADASNDALDGQVTSQSLRPSSAPGTAQLFTKSASPLLSRESSWLSEDDGLRRTLRVGALCGVVLAIVGYILLRCQEASATS